jgi:hypothetical protein
MVTDGSKEQTLGDFRRKLREADCHLRVTEPYSPGTTALSLKLLCVLAHATTFI